MKGLRVELLIALVSVFTLKSNMKSRTVSVIVLRKSFFEIKSFSSLNGRSPAFMKDLRVKFLNQWGGLNFIDPHNL